MVLTKYFIPGRRLMAMYNEKNELVLFYGDTLGIPPRRARIEQRDESPVVSEMCETEAGVNRARSSSTATTVDIGDLDTAEDTTNPPPAYICCHGRNAPGLFNCPRINRLPRIKNCFQLENLPASSMCCGRCTTKKACFGMQVAFIVITVIVCLILYIIGTI